ncbi:hypothetical protein [Bacillus toyonensis]|uniref:hypothetical protein n=1 Tax=Bacillus toyonensis TaxID=155322 RepID=UPI003D233C46
MELQNDFLNFLSNGRSSFTYLAGISAVIGAIIPLTTIIFAQFYDKSAERSNEYFWDIREQLSRKDINISEIQFMFKKLTYISANRAVFQSTLILFYVVSLPLCFLWILVCVGYLNNTEVELTSTDTFSIVVSTILLVLLLVFLPLIFSYFSKRLPVKVTNNGCHIEAIKKLGINNQKKKDLILDIFKPTIQLENISSEFKVTFKQSLPFNQYRILWLLKENNSSLFIKLDINRLNYYEENITYSIKNSSFFKRHLKKSSQLVESPTAIVSWCNKAKLDISKVYIQLNDGSIFTTGSVSKLNSEKVEFGLEDLVDSSVEGDIKEYLNKKGDILSFHKAGAMYSYKLALK